MGNKQYNGHADVNLSVLPIIVAQMVVLDRVYATIPPACTAWDPLACLSDDLSNLNLAICAQLSVNIIVASSLAIRRMPNACRVNIIYSLG